MIATLDPASGAVVVVATLPWDGTLTGQGTTITGIGDDVAPAERPVALALLVRDRAALCAELAGLDLDPATRPQLALVLSVLGALL